MVESPNAEVCEASIGVGTFRVHSEAGDFAVDSGLSCHTDSSAEEIQLGDAVRAGVSQGNVVCSIEIDEFSCRYPKSELVHLGVKEESDETMLLTEISNLAYFPCHRNLSVRTVTNYFVVTRVTSDEKMRRAGNVEPHVLGPMTKGDFESLARKLSLPAFSKTFRDLE